MKLRAFLMILALIFAMFLILLAAGGCHHISPQAQQTIQKAQDQAAEDAAAAEAQGEVDAAKAAAQEKANQIKAEDPVKHPILAVQANVKKAQKPLGLIATIAFLACGLGVGLYFTKLSWLSTFLVPVAGGVAAFAFFGVIALPFFPWVTLGLAVLLVGLLVYEIIRCKSLPNAIKGLESDLGITPAPALTGSTVGPIQVTLTHT